MIQITNHLYPYTVLLKIFENAEFPFSSPALCSWRHSVS